MIKLLSLLFSVFFIGCNLLMAQPDNSDSLQKDLNSYDKKDTIKVVKMIKYAVSLSPNEPARSLQVLDSAIQLSKEIDWKAGVAELYLVKGKINSRQEKYDAAIADYLLSLKLAEEAHLSHAYYDLHFNLSETYRLMGDHEFAMQHAKICYDMALAKKNEDAALYAASSIGEIYSSTKQFDSATLYLDKAMKLAVKLNNEYMQDRILGAQADILWDMGKKNWPVALALYRKNLANQEKFGSNPGTAWMHCVLSKAFTDFNIKDSAMYHGEKAMEISKKYNLTKEIKDSYQALYLAYAKFGNYKKAYEYKLVFDSLYKITYNIESGKNAEKVRLELDQQRKDAIANAEKIKRETDANRLKLILAVLAGLALIIALFQYRNNRLKQKAKAKIEKAYNELKQTQQQLIQSEKMASLGELTAGIAHEIQNPLNFVNNFSEVSKELAEEMKEELTTGNAEVANEIASDLVQNLEKINYHGQRAAAIVKGMLQHSRQSSGKKEPTDINALADEYLRLAYHGLRAKDKSFNAAFETNFDSTLPKLNVIPQDIGRVLLNIINNAFYAVNEKKKSAGLSATSYEPLITVQTKKVNDKVEVIVTDNGNGIPQNIIDKIFQPFFTTKPTGQGTGLGLSLAYDIVKAHGGELKVETKEGEGTTFIIQLAHQHD